MTLTPCGANCAKLSTSSLLFVVKSTHIAPDFMARNAPFAPLITSCTWSGRGRDVIKISAELAQSTADVAICAPSCFARTRGSGFMSKAITEYFALISRVHIGKPIFPSPKKPIVGKLLDIQTQRSVGEQHITHPYINRGRLDGVEQRHHHISEALRRISRNNTYRSVWLPRVPACSVIHGATAK